ncbi:MAG: hypothetical protein JSR48_10045 [Verrucomicrobia bacterium]|nr:hypothetical protein [Verrucomicrobiota bacterium]
MTALGVGDRVKVRDSAWHPDLRGQAGTIDMVAEGNPRGRSHEARSRYVRVALDYGIRLVSIDETTGGMVHKLADVQPDVWLMPGDVEAA